MILPHFQSIGRLYQIFTRDFPRVWAGCEMVGGLKRGKIWEMKIDAPKDLQSSDVINKIIASKLKCCFFTDGFGVFFLLLQYASTLNAAMPSEENNQF